MWRGPNHALPGRTPVFFGKELQRPSERDSSVLRKRTQACVRNSISLCSAEGTHDVFATVFQNAPATLQHLKESVFRPGSFHAERSFSRSGYSR